MKSESQKPNARRPDNSAHPKILRFRKSERLLHWALAIPFMVCLGSALVLVVHYNPDPTRPYRAIFAATHRIAGIAFIVLPILVTVISKGDFRIHFYNIRQAWIWTVQDVKWLLMMGLAAVSKKISLPDQGKFNAAEKLNFMYLMSTYSFYVLSGFVIWLTHAAFLAWIVHCAIALLSIPLILGHIYMATINAGSRVGLSGMFSGYVCRHWAKHHYTKWYQEHFADDHQPEAVTSAAAEKAPRKIVQTEPTTSKEPEDTLKVAMEVLERLEQGATANPTSKSLVSKSPQERKSPSHRIGAVANSKESAAQNRKVVTHTTERDSQPSRTIAGRENSGVITLIQRRSA